MIRLLGIDPGLRFTGWGLIDVAGNRLCHVADGVIATDSTDTVPARLKVLHDALMALLERHQPAETAVEETYVNRNGSATLKLGYARGVALLAPALAGLPVTEYAAKTVKMAVVGTGGGGEGASRHHGTSPAAWRYVASQRCRRCIGSGNLSCAPPVFTTSLGCRGAGLRRLVQNLGRD